MVVTAHKRVETEEMFPETKEGLLVLSERTRKIISSFNLMNKGLWFAPGNELKTISESRDIVAYSTIEETIPQEFGLYELSRFLNLLNLYKDTQIRLNRKSLTIFSGSNNTKSYTYTYADKETILQAHNDRFEMTEELVIFSLSEQDLNELLKVSAISSLNDIAFMNDGGDLSICVLDHDGAKKDVYKNVICEVHKPNFTIYFDKKKLNSLMPDDYTITLGKLNDAYVAQFKSKDIEYLIASEDYSK